MGAEKGIASFDVFDTCLTRSIARSTDLFFLLGEHALQRGLTSVHPDIFHRWRIQAEFLAGQSARPGEPSLGDIYAQFARIASWNEDQSRLAKELELEFEARVIVPVTAMRRCVEQARLANYRVLFLSDMYLPRDFIQGLLARHGFWRMGDELIVSVDSGSSKKSGRAFAEIRERHDGRQPWTHVGDHWRADVLMPRLSGGRARHVTSAKLNRLERRTFKATKDSFTHLPLAGVMRAARVSIPEAHLEREIIWQVGIDVVGPLLFGFVLWCLEQAREQSLNTLYFLSRDGQILHRIAKLISSHWGFDAECRYLYASRQAWHPAAVTSLGANDLGWILHRTHGLTLSDVLARLDLSPNQIERELRNLGFDGSEYDRPLLRSDLDVLANALLSGPLKSAVEDAARSRREIVLSYFNQEDIFGAKTYALVDIGWYGNLQLAFAKLLDTMHARPSSGLKGFYLGLHADRPKQTEAGEMRSYWEFCGMSSRSLRLYNLALFEIFCAADHGSVIRFEKQKQNVMPVLASPNNEPALAWGLSTLHASILAFAERLLGSCGPDAYGLKAHKVGLANFRMFHDRPTRQEASAWGTFRFSDSQFARELYPIVPDWTYAEIIKALFNRRRQPYGWWYQGTLAVQSCLPLRLYVVALRTIMYALQHFLSDDLYFRVIRALRTMR